MRRLVAMLAFVALATAVPVSAQTTGEIYGKVMGTVGGGMTAMLAMLKDQFGIDVARLAQAKTLAATAEAEAQAPVTTPPPSA